MIQPPQMAQRALAIDPVCPEAYNLLALNQAATLEEALELYRKAVELGPQVCGSGGRVGAVHKGG